MTNAPTPKRRWYQYSLRSMFVLTTLVAIACSWYAYEMKEAAQRRAAIAEFNERGGFIVYYEADDPNADSLPMGLCLLRGLHGDEQLGNAVALFCFGSISDCELVRLTCLTNLYGIHLGDSQISDVGLASLSEFKKLKHLWLNETQISDSGLVRLRSLTNLESLDLWGTQISDAGLTHLKRLNKLHTLTLMDTQVTEEGVKELQEALPNCEIRR